MTTLENLEPMGEVVADDRARIAFGKIGVRGSDRFAAAKSDDGTIVLTPLASIPKRELVIWENKELRDSLTRAMADAAAGRVGLPVSFEKYLDQPDDE